MLLSCEGRVQYQLRIHQMALGNCLDMFRADDWYDAESSYLDQVILKWAAAGLRLWRTFRRFHGKTTELFVFSF